MNNKSQGGEAANNTITINSNATDVLNTEPDIDETQPVKRIGSNVRIALDKMVNHGNTIKDAAKLANMKPDTLAKRLNDEHVRAELNRLASERLQNIRGLALNTLEDLMADKVAAGTRFQAAKYIMEKAEGGSSALKEAAAGGGSAAQTGIQIVINRQPESSNQSPDVIEVKAKQ